MHSQLSRLPVVAACLMASAVVAAETTLEETVIVGSRVATSLAETAVSVSVLDQQDLRLLGYPDLATALATQPGITVTSNGGLGKAATLSIRGEQGFRTRIMLDGIDLADPSSPQISPRIEQLLSTGIERVEVLRGPQGLAYGADAGGVIAITTLAPGDEPDANLFAETGADGLRRLSGDARGSLGPVSASLSVSDLDSDGFNARTSDTDPADDDGYQNTTLHSTVKIQATDNLAFTGTFHSVDGDNAYDNCFDVLTFAPINECADTFDQEAWRTAASYRTDTSEHTLAWSQSSIDRDFFSAGIPSFAADGEQESLSLLGYWQARDAHRLSYGVETETDAFSDGSLSRERDNLGVWGELAQQLAGGGTVTAGLRWDDNDDFGEFVSWRVSGVYPVALTAGELRLRGSVGTGFRAPSLYEIAYNSGPFAAPPASTTSLSEEQTAGWEASARWIAGGTDIEAVYFDQRIDDEILFDLSSFSGYLQQDGESRSTGVEVIASQLLTTALRLEANLTWNDTETAAGQQSPFRPEWFGNLGLRYVTERWNGALTARGSSNAVDNLEQPMEDWVVLDVSAEIFITPSLSLTARVENLLDESYEVVRDFNTGGQRWALGARYAL